MFSSMIRDYYTAVASQATAAPRIAIVRKGRGRLLNPAELDLHFLGLTNT
jgi:hypothetical protein